MNSKSQEKHEVERLDNQCRSLLFRVTKAWFLSTGSNHNRLTMSLEDHHVFSSELKTL